MKKFGAEDDDVWTFVVNPQYAEIEEGINTMTSKASCDTPHEPFLVLDPLTRQYVKHYSINVTGVPAGAGAGSQEPLVFPAPGEDSSDGGDRSDADADGDEESTPDGSLFG